jgi:hypothetical protein
MTRSESPKSVISVSDVTNGVLDSIGNLKPYEAGTLAANGHLDPSVRIEQGLFAISAGKSCVTVIPKTVARILGMIVFVANVGVKSTYVIPDPALLLISHGAAKQGFSLLPKKTAVGNGRFPAQALTGVLASAKKIAGKTAKTAIRIFNIFEFFLL